MSKKVISDPMLDGYRQANADLSQQMRDICASQIDPLKTLDEAHQIIIKGARSAEDLNRGAGRQQRPENRRLYIDAVIQTQAVTLDIIRRAIPVLQVALKSSPDNAIDHARNLMWDTRRLVHHNTPEFEAQRHETHDALGRMGAEALLQAKLDTRDSGAGWLYMVEQFIQHATPKTQEALFIRAEKIQSTVPSVRSLQFDLSLLHRQTKAAAQPTG